MVVSELGYGKYGCETSMNHESIEASRCCVSDIAKARDASETVRIGCRGGMVKKRRMFLLFRLFRSLRRREAGCL